MEWTVLYEREIVCPICDARGMTYANERDRVQRCPECGCAADLFEVTHAGPLAMGLVWLTLLTLCGLFWYAVFIWWTS